MKPFDFSYFTQTLVVLGHSNSDNNVPTGVDASLLWHQVFPGLMNAQGCRFKGASYSYTGMSSCQILGMMAELAHKYFIPDIGAIDSGSNDQFLTEAGTSLGGTANTIYTKSLANGGQTHRNSWQGQLITITVPGHDPETKKIIGFYYDTVNNRGVATIEGTWTFNPTSSTPYSIARATGDDIQRNIQALVKVFKYQVKGGGMGKGVTVYSQDDLPQNGEDGQRYIVYHDTSATGGRKSNGGIDQHPTISGNFYSSAQQTVWEFRNGQAGEWGWGRVAAIVGGEQTPAWGTDKVLVKSAQYLNFETGAGIYDNFGMSREFDDYIYVRLAQKAAAEAEGVLFSDEYEFHKMKIYGGTFLGEEVEIEQRQGLTSMFVNPGVTPFNRHYSTPDGHFMVGECAFLTAKHAGWINIFKKTG